MHGARSLVMKQQGVKQLPDSGRCVRNDPAQVCSAQAETYRHGPKQKIAKAAIASLANLEGDERS